MISASMAFLDALSAANVECIFANFGSDHPALIEALAQARAQGRGIPRVITCPAEMVALSAAHGHALISGRAQAVVVHVDCGTQALGGALHNAMRARVPVLIFAGMAPVTQRGELLGTRNEFIHWLQDVRDQRGIVRSYVKHDAEIRTGHNMAQMVQRALQIAGSAPAGPVYLAGAREVMEEILPAIDAPRTPALLSPRALSPDGVARIANDLAKAKRPLVVTSYIGRNHEAVAQLVKLADLHGVAVLESAPSAMNFPSDHPLHQGNHWNQPMQNPALESADCVLVIDSDVPWVPLVNRPASDAILHHIDIDPLKRDIPLWAIDAATSHEADAAIALAQIMAALDGLKITKALVQSRIQYWRALADKRRATLLQREAAAPQLSAEYLTARIAAHVGGDGIVFNEGISHYHVICDHMRRTKPGTMFTSGSSSLGWNGGAALGAKLAQPEALVVALTGDGSYIFSQPSVVHWMARRYELPFLQVVYNNRGWRSPKLSTLAVHPHGFAARANNIDVSFDPPPDHGGIAAAAGGALALKLTRTEDVDAVLEQALHAIRVEKRAAVIDAWLPAF